MHLFRTEGTREKFKILIEDKLEYKLQTTMQRELKRMTVVEEDDSRSEYLEDDGVELRIL